MTPQTQKMTTKLFNAVDNSHSCELDLC